MSFCPGMLLLALTLRVPSVYICFEDWLVISFWAATVFYLPSSFPRPIDIRSKTRGRIPLQDRDSPVTKSSARSEIHLAQRRSSRLTSSRRPNSRKILVLYFSCPTKSAKVPWMGSGMQLRCTHGLIPSSRHFCILLEFHSVAIQWKYCAMLIVGFTKHFDFIIRKNVSHRDEHYQ